MQNRLIFRVTAPHKPAGYTDHVQSFATAAEAVKAFDAMRLTLRIIAFAAYTADGRAIGTAGNWTAL